MDLPPELLSAIFALLCKRDLKKVRLVSKKFSMHGAVQLFNSIHVAVGAKDIDDARSISENFGSHVRTITISGPRRPLESLAAYHLHYDDQNLWYDFENTLREHYPQEALQDLHMSHIAAVYDIMREEREMVLTPEGLEKFLPQLFHHAPRIGSVNFKHRPRDRYIAHTEPQKWCVEPHCASTQRLVYCHLRNASGGQFTSSDVEDMMARVRITLCAISRAELGIKDLRFISRWHEYPMYTPTLSIPTGLEDTFELPSSLSTLCLTVDVDCHGVKAISKWLAVLSNLERLHVIAQAHRPDTDLPTTTFEDIFACCSFPRLRFLMLQRCHSEVRELSSFLRSCGQIEQLVLLDHHLPRNSVKKWHEAVTHIRNTIHFEPLVNIEDLKRSIRFGEGKPEDWSMEHWVDFDVGLTKILSGKGTDWLGYRMFFWRKHERPTYRTLDHHLLQELWGFEP